MFPEPTRDRVRRRLKSKLRNIEGHETDLQERIRLRAYFLYLSRNKEDGHALDDWLQAEAEMTDSDQP